MLSLGVVGYGPTQRIKEDRTLYSFVGGFAVHGLGPAVPIHSISMMVDRDIQVVTVSPHHLTGCADWLSNFVFPTGLNRHFLTLQQLLFMAFNKQSDCQHVGARGQMTAAFARSANHIRHVRLALLIGSDRTSLRGISPATTRWATWS